MAESKCANWIFFMRQEENLAIGRAMKPTLVTRTSTPFDLYQKSLPSSPSTALYWHLMLWHLDFLLEIIVFYMPYLFFYPGRLLWIRFMSTSSIYQPHYYHSDSLVHVPLAIICWVAEDINYRGKLYMPYNKEHYILD